MTDSVFEQLQTILRCPITKQGLRLLERQEVMSLNDLITKGELLHMDGTPVQAVIEEGFISQDGQFVYPVLEGVIFLMMTHAIPVTPQQKGNKLTISAEKKILQDFYDLIGWQKGGKKRQNFVDAVKWEDLRPVSREYVHNCHMRVKRYLKEQGHYFLDAGSGSIQYEEYLKYSENYDYRICLDISFLALQEAREKLGNKGIYLLGDLGNLPMMDNTMDGAVALHVVYHLPKDEQVTAIREIQRVLTPGSSAAIVYSWPNPRMLRWLLWPRRIKKKTIEQINTLKRKVKNILRKGNQRAVPLPVLAPAPPYRYTHDLAYFEKNLKGIDFEVRPWRSVNVPFMRMYIHSYLFGSALLRYIYHREEKEPALYGRIGQYPIFVVHKS